MSSSGGGGGRGKKRGVNVELNLVPFIDLLSTLICFLLITAVWQQISVVSTNSAQPSASESSTSATQKKVALSVSILINRLEASEDKKIIPIPNVNGDPDFGTLEKILAQWKARYPDRSDLVIYSDSQAPYKTLIRLMDTAIGAQFEDVGVNTN